MDEKPLPAVQRQVPQQNSVPNLKEIEIKLQENNPKVFEGVSNTKKARILKAFQNSIRVRVSQSISHTETSLYSGPVPSPEVLKEYLDISPKVVEDIFDMAKREQKY